MYPLEALMMDCHEYFKQTSRRITLEYTLMEGVNDSLEQVYLLPIATKFIYLFYWEFYAADSQSPSSACE